MLCGYIQGQLQTTVDGLNAAADSLRQNVTGIANDITSLVARVSGPVLDNFINGVSWNHTGCSWCISVYHMYMCLIALDCQRIC